MIVNEKVRMLVFETSPKYFMVLNARNGEEIVKLFKEHSGGEPYRKIIKTDIAFNGYYSLCGVIPRTISYGFGKERSAQVFDCKNKDSPYQSAVNKPEISYEFVYRFKNNGGSVYEKHPQESMALQFFVSAKQ